MKTAIQTIGFILGLLCIVVNVINLFFATTADGARLCLGYIMLFSILCGAIVAGLYDG